MKMTCLQRSRLNPRKLTVQVEKQRPRVGDGGPWFSAAKTQALDELLVLRGLCGSEIIEELAALVHEFHQPAARSVVTLVRREMFAQSVDALREQCDLHLRRAGVGRPAAVLCEYPALFLAG